MKIAFVNLGRHFGGIELYIMTLVKAWKKQGKQCLILARKDSTFYQKMVQEGFADETCAVGFDWKSIKETRKLMLKEQVDIFHVNGINSGVFVNLLNLPIKRVTTVHGSAAYDRMDKPVLIQKLFVRLENGCLKKNAQIISVSAAIKDLLAERGIDRNKINVVYNGIREIAYDAASGEKAITDRKELLRICFVGRLEKVKGCEYLLRALALIKGREYICDIYGDGSLREELMQLAAALQIKDKVRFKGFAENIRELLNQYDVLVLPSVYEAFPLTLLEAMNARVLMICSDAGGMKELVTDYENGLKFQVADAEGLAEKLIWAAEHPAQADVIKEKAFAQFCKEYTETIMCKKTFGILERVYHEL